MAGPERAEYQEASVLMPNMATADARLRERLPDSHAYGGRLAMIVRAAL